MWYAQTTFYQIYPLGFCGAPGENDNIPCNRIAKVNDWIPHLKQIGAGAVYFGPVFDSDAHGYDTRCYRRIDPRLGGNKDFARVCRALHEAGIRVVPDGVFNHVGRGFWAFRDLLEKRENSPCRDWFHVDFGGNSSYNDGLWYEGWEGHYNLVKLNLLNPQVVEYLLESIRLWVEWFDIDGLRLDVAYLLDEGFLRQLRGFCKGLKPDFYLLGEAIHGDYNRIVNGEMLDSCTNYECYKGLHSSFNAHNLFEIGYSLNRQFGPEQWTLYKGKPLFNFADNHDVDRIASTLKEPNHLKPLFALLFTMPGVPCVYYGSEWGAQGKKENGDDSGLRPCFDRPVSNDLTEWIARLSGLRRAHPVLGTGSYRQLYLTNDQLAFLREGDGSRILAAINASAQGHTAHLPQAVQGTDLLSGQPVAGNALTLEPYGVRIIHLS